MISIGNYYVNKMEEKCISGGAGCGVIYLTGCNMHCCYCSVYKISQLKEGKNIKAEQLADIMIKLMNEGCSHISIANISEWIKEVIEAVNIAKSRGFNLPIIYNSNGYEQIEDLYKIKDIFDIYLIDFKYADNLIGFELSGVKDYYSSFLSLVSFIKEEFKENECVGKELIRGVIFRHLVIPNYYENSRKVVALVKDLGLIRFPLNLMEQYVPEYKAQGIQRINSFVDMEEFIKIENLAKKLEIDLL